MKKRKAIRNERGFTLVEIIAVLIIMGIMAAVAAPKFISMSDQARKSSTQAGVNEALASISVAYHKAYLIANGGTVNADDVSTAAGFTKSGSGNAVFGDVTVSISVTDTDTLTVKGIKYKATAITGGPSETWDVPSQN